METITPFLSIVIPALSSIVVAIISVRAEKNQKKAADRIAAIDTISEKLEKIEKKIEHIDKITEMSSDNLGFAWSLSKLIVEIGTNISTEYGSNDDIIKAIAAIKEEEDRLVRKYTRINFGHNSQNNL